MKTVYFLEVDFLLPLDCESALPATDLDALLERPSLRILEALEATFLDVCFLLAMNFTSFLI